MSIVHMGIAALTVGFGLVSVIRPSVAAVFTGLVAEGARGVSEIRSVLGGVFVGLGVAALLYQAPEVFATLGIGYLAIGAVRLGSIAWDRASTASNWASLAFEVVCGMLLLL